jgi:hypothetical protein
MPARTPAFPGAVLGIIRAVISRRLLTFLAAISLLMCVAAGVLWWRSWHHAVLDEDRYSWLTSRGDRCTIRSDAGRVTLFEPPVGNPEAVAQLPPSALIPKPALAGDSGFWPPPYPDPKFQFHRLAAGTSLPTARETAAAIRNDQLDWRHFISAGAFVSAANSPKYIPQAQCQTRVGSAAFLFCSHSVREEMLEPSWFPAMQQVPAAFSTPDAIAVLLPALEDPQRIVAAHVLLMHLVPQATVIREPYTIVSDGVTIDGLRVGLRKAAPGGKDVLSSLLDYRADYDASQFSAIRDQWHRRLDVAVYTAPWWAVTAATALLPMIWIVQLLRRRRIRGSRFRAGRCLGCGYDLRSSSGRCPECGAVPPLPGLT